MDIKEITKLQRGIQPGLHISTDQVVHYNREGSCWSYQRRPEWCAMASSGSKLVPFNLLSSLSWYTHLRQSLLGEPQKQIFGKSWEFGPRRGGLTQYQIYFKIYQNLICLVAIVRGFPNPNQKITKNDIKITNHQKMGLFHEKIIC